ncbi:hypothetical protein [Nocardia sp. SSK8]|uniref:hypothetical protein n=1 Tax=Nocardia sp. SSK8 TaxID=3120154 RepID=UPI00300A5643
MAEENRDTPLAVPTLTDIVAALEVPADAHLVDTIKRSLLAAIDGGLDDPETVAALAIGPILVAVGRLESDLADARTRIDYLEQALRERDGHAR